MLRMLVSDDILRMLVTGGPPVRGGGGMPQRIVTIKAQRSSSSLWRPLFLLY